MPPFEPIHPSRSAHPGPFGPGPGRGAGRPSAAPGYGTSAGRRTAPPGTPGLGARGAPGGPGSVGPGRTFGGYAQVIRPADHLGPAANRVQPNPGQPVGPASSARPADRDIYVYRDVSDPAPTPSARHLAADDTAYWYDLLAEDPVPRHEETRGPFEPLLSSSGTPSAAGPGGTEQVQGPPHAARGESPEAPEQARARKLEQLKDLYLTAEAIGEQNVDKHFDQLLARQRELISEYFRQSAAAKPAARPRDGLTAEAGAEHYETDDSGATGGPAGPPEGAGIRAEPPRAW